MKDSERILSIGTIKNKIDMNIKVFEETELLMEDLEGDISNFEAFILNQEVEGKLYMYKEAVFMNVVKNKIKKTEDLIDECVSFFGEMQLFIKNKERLLSFKEIVSEIELDLQKIEETKDLNRSKIVNEILSFEKDNPQQKIQINKDFKVRKLA